VWAIRLILLLTEILILSPAYCVGADLALVGATVYPAPSAVPVRHAVVLVRDGRIVAIGPESRVKIPASARRIACTGKFITAGFWNSHVHIFTPGLLHAATANAVNLDAELDAMLNRWGFTTVFDLASVLDNTLALRHRIDSGEVRGPRILTVGEPLWTAVPVYVIDYLAANHIAMGTVSTPAEAVAMVQEHAQLGANGIKLFTGSVQRGKVVNMPLDVVRAATTEAHHHDLPVFAHPQNMTGLETAIDGGVDILAHTAPDSPPWTPQFVARMTQGHMALIPTLTLLDFEARKLGGSDSEREQLTTKMVGELRAFSQGGGEVLFGTDVGYTDHFDTALEYILMSQAGMTFPQILASLTTNPATRFRASHSGRVEKGMDADLVVLESDPAADVSALASVDYTIRAGTLVYARPQKQRCR
jgi:imidazolonepropionase-like amidohydrolase